ncbi:MAG: hypothetical protein WBR56_01885 [Sedimenticolaceae bacterium]
MSQLRTFSISDLLIVGLVGLVPAQVDADLIVELNDGKRIVVPVDEQNIRSITFTRSGGARGLGKEKQPSPEMPGTAASGIGRILRVGSDRKIKYPSDAARIARDGDTIEIDAGTYHNDYALWKQDNLTLRGVGGMAHLKSEGLIPNEKAIWIVNGNNVMIENIEFSGASVKDTNGAGIRHQGGALTLENTFFHDNEFSILTGKLPNANVEIRSSRFWFQKREHRYSHGIYIGQVRRLTLIGNHFTGTHQGHQVKSRALENHIFYNRIEDVRQGNSSRLIDLSNCGLSFVVGNDLHQAETSENLNAIGYGPEGCETRDARQMRLYVINNTFINEASSGSFVRNFAGGDVMLSNNLVFGKTEMLVGKGTERNNLRLPLQDRAEQSWSAPSGSAAIDRALNVGPAEGVSLVPVLEFAPPAGTRKRPVAGNLDIGSRERAR